MTWVFWAVWVGATVASFVLPKPERYAVGVLGDIAFIAIQVLWGHFLPGVVVGVLLLAWTLWQWWNNRKDRRRARELLGAKAKALRAALVRRMGERAVPGKPLPARQ